MLSQNESQVILKNAQQKMIHFVKGPKIYTYVCTQ